MELNNKEKNIINNYWKTLKRKNISNISVNKFIKKPYIEKYIIDLSVYIDKNELIEKILNLFENNVITNDEILFFINNYIDISNYNKKNIEKIFLENDISDDSIKEICIEIILYSIDYFRIYETISELLFNCDEENNELYHFIYVYIKNNKKEIKLYVHKNIKFKIFYYYLNDLYNHFIKMNNIFMKNNLICNNNDYFNNFIKLIFNNWYSIYKKDVMNNHVEIKVQPYIIKKNIFSRLLCMNNSL